jgi:hypothetical protein
MRHLGFAQGTLDGECREALVPEGHGQVEVRLQVGGELAHRLAAWSLAAVHADGQADDEPRNAALAHDFRQPRRIGGELGAPQGSERGGHGQP